MIWAQLWNLNPILRFNPDFEIWTYFQRETSCVWPSIDVHNRHLLNPSLFYDSGNWNFEYRPKILKKFMKVKNWIFFSFQKFPLLYSVVAATVPNKKKIHWLFKKIFKKLKTTDSIGRIFTNISRIRETEMGEIKRLAVF